MVGLSAAPSALTALAFLKDKVPNEAAVAVSPTVGWLMLAGALAVFALCILHSQWWRRFWLVAEDPRSVALWRIVFGFFIVANVNDFYEYFTFLFTDEGIFTADVARQVHASAQFEGFGDGFNEQDDPWGFFDLAAFGQFMKGPKYSLLYFWDTPEFFWGHWAAFMLTGTFFMIGFRTRLMGVLTFFLMNSIFFRNHLFWEGTELVYRVFMAYLICAKSGHAYSVDNWLRCRRLRKKGLLSTRDGPGGGAGVAPSQEHPTGLEAIYRRIPSWPRKLAMLQLCCVYAFTGIVKNGSVWAKGYAVYYAWNMDHFYRFYPQPLSEYLGTNLIRIATWYAHWGEVFFAVVFISILTKFAIKEKIPRLRGGRWVATQLCWAVIVGISAALIWVTWEVHFVPPVPKAAFVGAFVAILLAAWAIWIKLDRKPFQVKGYVGVVIGWAIIATLGAISIWYLWPPHQMRRMWGLRLGMTIGWVVFVIALPLVIRRLRRKPIFPTSWMFKSHTIDRYWVCSWILGRRIWVTWNITLMAGINILMNIGQFQTGMLSQSFPFIVGLEAAIILRMLGRWLAKARVPGIPDDVKQGKPPIPEEDPTLPHLKRDAARLPQWAMWFTLLVFLGGILVRVKVQPEWEWRWIWVGGFLFLAGVAFQRWLAARGQKLSVMNPDTGEARPTWGYGAFGRFAIGSLLVWHITGVTTWVTPDKDSLREWRGPARKVFAKWLTLTQTDQGWGMFAPNPPRSNVFLKVLVTDKDGEVFDLKTDVYAPERKPIPWIWNDRMRKMNRRIIGGESGNTQWYRKWYSRYVCRQWALEHDGEAPQKVDLVKMWYRIPSPNEVARQGWYSPEKLLERTGAEKMEHTENCKRTVMGQLPDWIRERHGLPLLGEDEKYRPWLKHKKRKWERKRAKERGEEDPAEKERARKKAEREKRKAERAAEAEAKRKERVEKQGG